MSRNRSIGSVRVSLLRWRPSFLPRPASIGFTLIELLVVIAIIALLVSILMPSLHVAKELAKRSVCQSNQHQIAIALVMYANDSESHLPNAHPGANASTSTVVRSPGGGWHGLGRLFDRRILTGPRVLYCPSQKETTFTYPDAWEPPPPYEQWKWAGYIYRLFGQTAPSSNPPITQRDVDDLCRMTLERAPARFGMSADIFGHIRGQSWSHLKPYTLNVAFTDGHAEPIDVPFEEYDRATYYNNTTDEGYQYPGVRDPFVFYFWQALDKSSFAYMRKHWPI